MSAAGTELQTIDLSQVIARDESEVDGVMQQYYPMLQAAFPLEGEIETPEVYMQYLLRTARREELEWHLNVVRNNLKQIVGGLHFQVLTIKGVRIAWGEHAWIARQHRSWSTFCAMRKLCREQVSQAGVELCFFEFNDPGKMSEEEIEADRASGVDPLRRARCWAANDACVLVTSEGEIAPYAQPSMGGEPPVKFLSLGFLGIGLEGTVVPAEDYTELLRRAFLTIPAFNPETDETYAYICSSVSSAGGTFTFRRLRAILR